MKINSNTISLDNQDTNFKALESIITKIAKDNSIKNVNSIKIELAADSGIINFKVAAEGDEVAGGVPDGSIPLVPSTPPEVTIESKPTGPGDASAKSVESKGFNWDGAFNDLGKAFEEMKKKKEEVKSTEEPMAVDQSPTQEAALPSPQEPIGEKI
jgi:hypothetical protein